MLAEFAHAGIDADALAAQLQREGAESFTKSWRDLLDVHRREEHARLRAGQKSAGRRMSAQPRRRAVGARPNARRGKRCSSTTRRSRRCICASFSPPIRGRGERLSAEAAGLYLDYSKNRVTDETLTLLLKLAEECRLAERIEAMFSGEKINVTEERAVLHVALRAPRGRADCARRRGRRARSARGARAHGGLLRSRCAAARWRGHTGQPIRNVINIGIGGSDLGPVMAYEALRHYSRAT